MMNKEFWKKGEIIDSRLRYGDWTAPKIKNEIHLFYKENPIIHFRLIEAFSSIFLQPFGLS